MTVRNEWNEWNECDGLEIENQNIPHLNFSFWSKF